MFSPLFLEMVPFKSQRITFLAPAESHNLVAAQ